MITKKWKFFAKELLKLNKKMKFLTHLLSKNFLVKIVGVFLILYFGVYKYDESPDSLSKRLNKKTISHDLEIATDQTKKIFNAVVMMKDLKKKGVIEARDSAELSRKNSDNLRSRIAVIDSLKQEVATDIEDRSEIADCDDSVNFSYIVTDGGEAVLLRKKKQLVKISEKKEILFERLLFGMVEKEVKEVTIDRDHGFMPTIIRKQFLLSTSGKIIIRLKLEGLFKQEIVDGKKKVLRGSQKLICRK